MKKIISIISLLIYTLPLLASAESVTDANSLFNLINNILDKILPIIISVAVIWFIYNVFAYVIAGDEDKKAAAKNNMIWGIIALFVMISVWGLVGILTGTIKLNNSTPSLPGLPRR